MPKRGPSWYQLRRQRQRPVCKRRLYPIREDNSDCGSGACGLVNAHDGTRVCCVSTATFSQTITGGYSGRRDLCPNEAPVGANCGAGVDRLCITI